MQISNFSGCLPLVCYMWVWRVVQMTALMNTVTGHGSFLLLKTKISHSNHAINVPTVPLQNHKRYRHGGITSMQMDLGQMTSEQMSLRMKETTWSVYVKGPFTNLLFMWHVWILNIAAPVFYLVCVYSWAWGVSLKLCLHTNCMEYQCLHVMQSLLLYQ